MCRTKVIDLNDGVSQYAWYPCTANFQYSHMTQTIFWLKVGNAHVIQKSPLCLPIQSFSNRQSIMGQSSLGQAVPFFEVCLVQISKKKASEHCPESQWWSPLLWRGYWISERLQPPAAGLFDLSLSSLCKRDWKRRLLGDLGGELLF